MKKTSFYLTLIFISHHSIAHELPHQEDITSIHCAQNSQLTIHNFDDQRIQLWFDEDFTSNIEIEKSIDNDCSIYFKPDGIVDPLCGEVDHFMMAAQAAIHYCERSMGTVPYFFGPQNFMDAMTEATLGNHHKGYDLSDGIKFACIQTCPDPLSASDEEDL